MKKILSVILSMAVLMTAAVNVTNVFAAGEKRVGVDEVYYDFYANDDCTTYKYNAGGINNEIAFSVATDANLEFYVYDENMDCIFSDTVDAADDPESSEYLLDYGFNQVIPTNYFYVSIYPYTDGECKINTSYAPRADIVPYGKYSFDYSTSSAEKVYFNAPRNATYEFRLSTSAADASFSADIYYAANNYLVGSVQVDKAGSGTAAVAKNLNLALAAGEYYAVVKDTKFTNSHCALYITYVPNPVTAASISGNYGNALTLSWTPAEGVDGYAVGFKVGDQRTEVAKVQTTSYTFTNLTPSTSYTVYVLPYMVYGDKVEYGTGRRNTVTTNAEITSPFGGITAVAAKTNIKKLKAAKKGFTVKVAAKEGVMGYQVQYSKKKNMKGAKIKTFGGASTKVKGLKSKKKYYVRVRTFGYNNGQIIYSGWSGKKAVKTK